RFSAGLAQRGHSAKNFRQSLDRARVAASILPFKCAKGLNTDVELFDMPPVKPVVLQAPCVRRTLCCPPSLQRMPTTALRRARNRAAYPTANVAMAEASRSPP